jgi:hypothetical protein
MLIRNDDVAYDANLDNIKWFCELCDGYGFKIIQAITPIGSVIPINVKMDNDEIKRISGIHVFRDNERVYDYLTTRADIIGLHGLYHTHVPSKEEITRGKELLSYWGLRPDYFVIPFNEGNYPETIEGLKISGETTNLEIVMMGNDTLRDEIAYLHSWRFDKWYKREDLEKCLKHLSLLLNPKK